jgi:hypothetical protein
MTKIYVIVDTPYEDADGNANYTYGQNEVDASEESARNLYDEGKAQYVDEEDEQKVQEERAKESDANLSDEVDNSARVSSSLGMKFGDANASNKSPHGDTDVADAVGETGVSEDPKPSLRQRAYADTYPERQQAVQDAAPDAASSGASTSEGSSDGDDN